MPDSRNQLPGIASTTFAYLRVNTTGPNSLSGPSPCPALSHVPLSNPATRDAVQNRGSYSYISGCREVMAAPPSPAVPGNCNLKTENCSSGRSGLRPSKSHKTISSTTGMNCTPNDSHPNCGLHPPHAGVLTDINRFARMGQRLRSTAESRITAGSGSRFTPTHQIHASPGRFSLFLFPNRRT